jgi:hypothetical protein
VSFVRVPQRIGGTEIAALFAAQDRLGGLGGDALLDARITAPSDLIVERYCSPGSGERCVLDREHALGTRRRVSPALADFVLRVEGGRRLRQIADAREHLEQVRSLLKLGFLTFA